MSNFLPTGINALDGLLYGGWPKSAITELCSNKGAGKTSLALQTATQLTQQKHWVALISPMQEIFFPPTLHSMGINLSYILWIRPNLEERCKWATEQITRSGLFSLIIISHVFYNEKQTRRLQLTCEKNNTTVLMLTTPYQHINRWALSLSCFIKRTMDQKLMLDILRSRKQIKQSSIYLNYKNHEPENISYLSSELTHSKLAS